MVVIMPIWKNTSLVKPRPSVASTAPKMPKGTTSMTEKGIDQLSYKAARLRNTISMDSAMIHALWLPALISSYDRPVHTRSTPGGSCWARPSTIFIASPVLTPGAVPPTICTAETPL